MHRLATIESVCELVTDGTHYTPKDVGEGIPFLTVKDVSSTGLDFLGCSFITESDYRDAASGNSAPMKGDVLFSKDGTVGKVHVVESDKPFAVLSSLAILRPKRGLVDSTYLGHALRSPATLNEALKKKTGSAIRRIILSDLKRVRIYLPELPEQQRIAAILNQADALRGMRRNALEQLDSLTQSIFVEMFGDPVLNDREWPSVAISDFVKGFESGKSIVANDEDDSDSPYRVLKISAVTSLEYKPQHSKAIPSDYVPPASHFVRKGDLLFSRANTTELIGATALVSETPDNLLLPDKLWRFVWFDNPRAEPLYVRHLFQQAKFRHEIGMRASGSSGSMQNISQSKVLSIRVGHPPLNLQKKFSIRIEAIEAIKSRQRDALTKLDTLFASLQQRAFQGDL